MRAWNSLMKVKHARIYSQVKGQQCKSPNCSLFLYPHETVEGDLTNEWHPFPSNYMCKKMLTTSAITTTRSNCICVCIYGTMRHGLCFLLHYHPTPVQMENQQHLQSNKEVTILEDVQKKKKRSI